MMTSPLRYPGGKTRACKILQEQFNIYFDHNYIDIIISPFFGGGSFELYLQLQYGMKIIANDKFTPLISFWTQAKESKEILINNINQYVNNITNEQLQTMRKNILTDNTINQAINYFIINRCSFSGATLSGGFSKEAIDKRFTSSSVDRLNNIDLTNIEFYNQDFTDFLADKNEFIFADPPYYLEKKSNLYGVKGDLHTDFNHQALYNIMKDKPNWIMTYNDCDYIRALYDGYLIIDAAWSYGMNKTKKSSEIIIVKNMIE